MGSGASNNKQTKSKRKNLQQPLSTQNTKPTRQQSTPNSEIFSVRSPSLQVQNQSSAISNDGASARRIKILSNGTEPPALSYQQKNDSDNDEMQLVPVNDSHKRSNKSPLSSNRSRTNSNASINRRIPINERSNTSMTEQIGHCPFCPHCKLLSPILEHKPAEPPPLWITQPPPNIQQHINMDQYDEDAVRNKLLSEHGRQLGSYDYPPHLTIEETKNPEEIPKKYFKLPIITKPESPMSPVHTPFPNYATLQHREKLLNKPYTSTLFTD